MRFRRWRTRHKAANQSLNRTRTRPCTGCGQETVCAYYDPECLDRLRKEPGAREVLLSEGPTRAN